MRALRKQGSISRTDISSVTGWSKAKSSQEIRSLIQKGYLVEIGDGVSNGGRKPRSASSRSGRSMPFARTSARIIETKVARELGTSQSPVREALRGGVPVKRLLVAEGLKPDAGVDEGYFDLSLG